MRAWIRRFLQRPGTLDLAPYRRLLGPIGEREDAVRELDDAGLSAAAGKLRRDDGRELDRAEVIELCALGREAARRQLGERPFDVQLLGVQALLSGRVAEMATGEGKTLTAAIAAAGYALRGRRVHVLTVNDYLARRDAEWMEPIYTQLGVTVGWVGQSSTQEQRRDAYSRDITYVAVNEAGFDYLRDGLCGSEDERVQPEPGVAIVDEADSVMVDEARVPLVLAGTVEPEGAGDPKLVRVIGSLRKDLHYETDADDRNVHLTELGSQVVEKALGIDLYDADNFSRLAAVNTALHAHALLHKDIDYIVRDGKVQLISESRGRVHLRQRWPDGLQAAVEAKETVAQTESGEVLDSITMQGFLRRYPVLAGMTGTAVAVGEQLREFYQLEIAAIPPNVPCVREDEEDRLYATLERKEDALVAEIAEQHAKGRPVLVGTLDVSESERLAKRLLAAEVPCVVLNAKNDAEEAAIIAEAGCHGAVTVSTQMAGRGTDIRLGGRDAADHERVAGLGGLYVIGSGRYDSSRLDGQLRGRAGRQGDPGGSVFFTSLQDELVQHYGKDEIPAVEDSSEVLTDSGAQLAVDHAQRVAEGVVMEIHRNTWRYHQLIEHQRALLKQYREQVLTTDVALEELEKSAPDRVAELRESVSEEVLAAVARQIELHHIDRRWAEHLAFLTDLREGIHLHALARQNPLDEFHRAAVPAFNRLRSEVRERTAETLEKAEVTEDGIDLGASGLRKPSSTWTYVVHDNPFGDEAQRAIGSVVAMLRGKRRRR
ncbi:accessory Sec system translocase SecA2 [Allokutzneria oryzae]|uniref:Protein translocase subunit SecA n=1 Tax=Allokutzneria oryzae TaxID=1378989 RepID=A0ABV5ZXA9_9PSEU